jgi:predicted transglutaminase-like cysteine proteinase
MRSEALLLVLLLAACSPLPPRHAEPMPDGGPAMPPAGWQDLCAREPETPRC